jgi:predicted ATP-dependent Lon-type protease
LRTHEEPKLTKKFQQVFRGKVVNKAHTINTGVDEFPRYVVEYLIDNYCSEDNLKEALGLPASVLEAITLTPVQRIDEVLRLALLD